MNNRTPIVQKVRQQDGTVVTRVPEEARDVIESFVSALRDCGIEAKVE